MADLNNAEDFLGHGSRRDAETAAREAAQVAEDARLTVPARRYSSRSNSGSKPTPRRISYASAYASS